MRMLIFFILIVMVSSLFAQSERKYIREGNKLYENKKYQEGEVAYRKAIDKKPESYDAKFNIGNSLYKQGKYLDAATQFGSLTEATKDNEKLARLYYNLGNSYLKANKLEESINAYKNSLLKNPKDQDAKFNLSYAMRMLQQQKNQQNNKDKQDKDQQNKQDQQNQQKNEEQNKKDEQNKQDQQKQDQQQQQNQQQQGKQGEKQISPEDAQRMLEAIQNDEKDLQKRLEEQKASSQRVKVLKNW